MAAEGNTASRFVHIEIVHSDPDAAAAYVCETLGGEIVEQGISGYLSTLVPDFKVVHVRVAGTVLQFVKPAPELESWARAYERNGACVHNVTVMVDDVEGVREQMLARGSTVAAELDVTLQDGGLEGLDGPQRVYVVDATEQTGLRFECLDTIDSWVPGVGP